MVEGSWRSGQIEGFRTLNIFDLIETEMLEICIPIGGEASYRWLNPPSKFSLVFHCIDVLVFIYVAMLQCLKKLHS